MPVLRSLAGVALAGLLLFVFAPGPVPALFGVLLWGAGTSLGFPVGMSAASDDPARAAARVSVVASIAYCAFLAGPPLIGLLADQVTVLRSLLCVGALLAVAFAIAGALRPLAVAQADD
jgi:cyanate permease